VSERHFDRELDRLTHALKESETRVSLMALFVTEATPLADVSRTLDIDFAALSYHAQVLESLGAVERQPDGRWAATELGIIGYSDFTDRDSGTR
jgi:hypothetical protein